MDTSKKRRLSLDNPETEKLNPRKKQKISESEKLFNSERTSIDLAVNEKNNNNLIEIVHNEDFGKNINKRNYVTPEFDADGDENELHTQIHYQHENKENNNNYYSLNKNIDNENENENKNDEISENEDVEMSFENRCRNHLKISDKNKRNVKKK